MGVGDECVPQPTHRMITKAKNTLTSADVSTFYFDTKPTKTVNGQTLRALRSSLAAFSSFSGEAAQSRSRAGSVCAAMGRAGDASPEIEIEWGGAHNGDTRDFSALHYLFGGLWLLGFLACAVRCALNPLRNMCLEPPAHRD
jgi:hypothetical protein